MDNGTIWYTCYKVFFPILHILANTEIQPNAENYLGMINSQFITAMSLLNMTSKECSQIYYHPLLAHLNTLPTCGSSVGLHTP